MKKLKALFCKYYLTLFVSILLASCSSNIENDEVINENTDPYLIASDFSVDVKENVTSDKILGNLEVDSNIEELTYSIKSQTHEGAITVNPKNGELKIAEIAFFDYEFFPILKGEIEILGDSLSKVINFTINITDVVLEYNYFRFQNETYYMSKLRENISSGKLNIASSDIDLKFDSGILNTGDVILFNYINNSPNNSNTLEGNYTLENKGLKKEISIGINYDSNNGGGLVKKNIIEGELIYKKSNNNNVNIIGFYVLNEYDFEIQYYFKFDDGKILTGRYKGKGMQRV